jgi:hypothetical protein
VVGCLSKSLSNKKEEKQVLTTCKKKKEVFFIVYFEEKVKHFPTNGSKKVMNDYYSS